MNATANDIDLATAERAELLHYALHPRAVDLWFWQILIWVPLTCLIGVVVSVVAGWWLVLTLIILTATLVARLLIGYTKRYAATFACVLSEDGLLIKRGVWWYRETYVPRARVQHTDVNQGPIARRFGIATLKVFTAGTHEGEIEVGGLAHTDALRLRDEMLGRHGHDAV
jgi:hypothetical protein